MTHSRGHFIGGSWKPGDGDELISNDPGVPNEVVWRGNQATEGEVDAAIASARAALPTWSDTPFDERVSLLSRFKQLVDESKKPLSEAIAQETGKPLWEATTEVGSVIGKLDPTVDAYHQRATEGRRPLGGGESVTRFRPHGVLTVLGPSNFPAHMPNGHIMPALLAGNTVVLKPSEYAPGVSESIVALWQEAGLPDGVFNLVQGNSAVGHRLATHPDIDGLLFTGSRSAGLALSKAMAETPWKICALEMGGNSPIVAWDYDDVDAAAITILQSCFVTAGQRCSAARRLIVQDHDDKIIPALTDVIANISVGHFTDQPEPYFGPVISQANAEHVLSQYQDLISRGGVPIVPLHRLPRSGAYLSPGLIDVSDVADVPDVEIFGPLLQVTRVAAFKDAIEEANRTCYGLAAGLISKNKDKYDEFLSSVRAGLINWNQQLTGASGWAPFGGIRESGSNRPSGYLAIDYCVYGQASIENAELSIPDQLPSGLKFATRTPSS